MEKQTWTELLSQIRKRPPLYLGSANLQAFQMVLLGFRMAEDLYEIPERRRQDANDFPWGKFEAYVSRVHNERQLALRSFGLAQYEAQGKGIDTFDSTKEYPGAWEIWWQWFDEFEKTG